MLKFCYIIIFKVVCTLFLLIYIFRIRHIKKSIFTRDFRNIINNLNIDSNKKKDLNYILNYRGTSIEPEWEWVKNISFVYTWIDGSDIDLSQIKHKYNGGNKNVDSRDRSSDELLYSLRSLKKYLPWHNGTIFLVTNNQTPKWLNNENKRIKIINHEEIIPKYINPTFDSSTIECFLDNIPEIGEIFIYMNDDFFFNNFVHPAFFFSSETFYPKIFRTSEQIMDIKNVEKLIKENNIHEIYGVSVYLTNEIIKKYFDINFKYYNLAHCAYVCYRSFFEPFRQFFHEELKVVFSYRFRCPYKPITLYLYQTLLLYANEKLEFNSTYDSREKLNDFKNKFLLPHNEMSKYSFELVTKDIIELFIKFSFVTDDSIKNFEEFNYFINNRNILMYNINDKFNNSQALYELTEYMMIRYPEKISFEKKNYVELEKKYLYYLKYANLTMKETNDFYYNRHKRFNYFQKMFFNENNINYIKEYIEKKKELSDNRNISEIDEEEMEILFNYDGRELSQEWQWIKNISIVYIITEEEKNFLNNFRYSLRSIKYYLPWFNGTIFIIVQNQDFDLSWINTTNKQIKIIYPKTIVQNKINDKYSKEIIEMFLDRIPFISERFIYLNINHYFKNFIHPRFFFNNEFFPKYYFEDFVGIPTIIQNKSFFKTYEAIKEMFGNHYFNNIRILVDSPISLYRDLFKPVRKLYLSKISEYTIKNFDLLPKYLLSTFNIYGSSQIYFPEYISGFGKIRKIKTPSMKHSKIISYYGFDMTSEIILKESIIKLDLSQGFKQSLFTLEASKALFFSIEIKSNYEKMELNLIDKLLKTFYNCKSSYEKYLLF